MEDFGFVEDIETAQDNDFGFIEDKDDEQDIGFTPEHPNILEQDLVDKKAQQEQQGVISGINNAITQAAKADPRNWSLEQSQRFFKDNPPQNIHDEAKKEVFLGQKKQEKEAIKKELTIGQLRQGEFRQPTEQETRAMQKAWEKKKGITRDVLGEFSEKHPLFPVFATTMPAFEAAYQALSLLPKFSETNTGKKIIKKLPYEDVMELSDLGFLGKQMQAEWGAYGDKTKIVRNPQQEAASVMDAVQSIAALVASGRIEEKASQKIVENSIRVLGGKLTAAGYGEARIEIPQEVINKVGKFTPSGEAILENINFRRMKIDALPPSKFTAPPKGLAGGMSPVENQPVPRPPTDWRTSAETPLKRTLRKGLVEEVGKDLEKVPAETLAKEPELKTLIEEAKGYEKRGVLAQEEVNRDVSAVAQELKLSQAQHAQPKSLKSIVSKALRKAQDRPDYTLDDLSDYGRGTVVLDDFNAQLPETVKSLRAKGWELSTAWGKEVFGGFRIFSLNKTTSNGLQVEMQVSDPLIWKTKREFSDKLYHEYRDLIEKPLSEMTEEELNSFNFADELGKREWAPVYARLDLERASMAATSSGESLTASEMSTLLPSEAAAGLQAPSSPSTFTGMDLKSTTRPSSNLSTKSDILPPTKYIAQETGVVNPGSLGLNQSQWVSGAESAASIPGEAFLFYGTKNGDFDTAKAAIIFDEAEDMEPLGYRVQLSNGGAIPNRGSGALGGSEYFETAEEAQKAVEDYFAKDGQKGEILEGVREEAGGFSKKPPTVKEINWDVVNWEKVSNFLKRKGYDFKGGKDAQEIYRRMTKEFTILPTGDHLEAIRYASQKRVISEQEKAARYFGYTDNLSMGGYITPEGKLLDFSGRRQGNVYSTSRELDHREINSVIDQNNAEVKALQKKNVGGNTSAMIYFMNKGNIRLQKDGIDLSLEPVGKQWKVIREHIQKNKGEGYFVDISDREGNTVKTFSYEYPNVDARKIIEDISEYFNSSSLGEKTAAYGGIQEHQSSMEEVSKSITEIRSSDLRERARKLSEVARAIETSGFVDFRGTAIPDAHAVAEVAVAFRHPKVENLQVIFEKGGKIIAHQVLSSGMPNQVATNAKFVQRILSLTEKLQPEGIYFAHNHPSGRPEPSQQDIGFTEYFGSRLGGKLKGHVVTDGDSYSLITLKDVRTKGSAEVKQYSFTKKLEEFTVSAKSLGSAELAAKEARDFVKEGKATVLFLDSNTRIIGIDSLGVTRNIPQYIRETKNFYGSSAYIIAYQRGDALSLVGEMPAGILDVIEIMPGGNTYLYRSKSEGTLKISYAREEDAQGKLMRVQEEGVTGYGEPPLEEEPAGYKEYGPGEKMEEAYDALSEEERARIELELDEIRKTPEGNLFVAIKRLGGIKPYREGYLAEELKQVPFYLKRNSGQTMDSMVSELKEYGWHFEDDSDLLNAIKTQAAHPVEKVNRAALKQIIKEAEKNRALQQKIEDSFKKRRKFIDTVKNAKKTAEEVRKGVESLYDPITNKDTLKKAQDFVTESYDAAVELAIGPGHPTAFSNAVAIVLIDKAQAEGRFQDAINLVEKTAEKATPYGQAIQALAMYERLTPEGILMYAHKVVKKARGEVKQKERLTNFEKIVKTLSTEKEKEALAKKLGVPYISDEFARDLREMAERIQGMPDGRDKIIETALMLKKVASLVPPSLLEKVSMVQTLAQLLNPKTFVRNLLGNIGFQGLENISDSLGTVLDIAASVHTGKRTTYLPDLVQQGKDLKKGFKEGTEEALLGIDLRGNQGKFSLPRNGVFNTGVMGALEKTLRISLSATDRAFYEAAFNQSLRNQMRASDATEPTAEMIEQANLDGLYRTFQDDNAISYVFVTLKKALNAGKKWGIGDIVLKYPKTPANILARGIEYSPFSFLKTVYELSRPFMGREYRQGEFVRATSRGFTGSALLVGTGALLASLGIISGKRDKDRDVAATRANVGIREYQINASALQRFAASGLDPEQAKIQEDDVLVSYDWLLPASIGLALGANMVIDEKESITDKALNLGDRILQASETLAEQPLVKGLKIAAGRENVAEGLSETIKEIPASFVPTLLNQIRQLTDNTVHNTKDPNYFKEMYNKAIQRIPGAASTLPERVNTLGEPQKMYQLDSNNPFNVFLNPAFVNRYKPDPVSRMVLDIWESTGEKIHFPRVASGKVKLGGDTKEPVELSPDEYNAYQSYIGHKTDVLFTILSRNDGFMRLSDDVKAKKLQGYLTDINTAAKIEVLGYRPKQVSGDVLSILKHIGANKRELDKIPSESDLDFEPEDLGFIEEEAAATQ